MRKRFFSGAKRGALLALLLAFLLGALPSLTACGKATSFRKEIYGYFDTVVTLYDDSGDGEAAFLSRCETVERVLSDYHELTDIYHEYEGKNNLATLNAGAGGEPIALDAALFDFLEYAKAFSEATGGVLDVMLGSVLSVWHDYREAGKEVPPDELLGEAAKHTALASLVLDRETGTARIADPDAKIDVGALAKGYAAEKACEALEATGASGLVLDAGGNLRAIGKKPGGDGWKTSVRNPDPGETGYLGSFTLPEEDLVAVATSGDYMRYYEVAGVRYHHIIDTKTNYPANYYSSVTVLAADAGVADALSTTLFCLPREEWDAVLSALGSYTGAGIRVIYQEKDGTVGGYRRFCD